MSAATTQPVTGPFLIVNPKAHLGGSETLRLALLTDELAAPRKQAV